MRGLLYIVIAGVATVNAIAIQERASPIPQPAPASAYIKNPPNPSGKSQPPVPNLRLNDTVDPEKIPNAKSGDGRVSVQAAAACSGPTTSNPSSYWMTQMDHTGNARGYAPKIDKYYTFPTWRNVLDAPYNAKNDGGGDQTAAIQAALNTDGRGGNRYSSHVVTAQPAHVFLPGGTYTLGSKLDLRLGTIIMGDPQNPPILKAATGFSDSILIQGYDSAAGQPETSFLTALRNVIIDTTAIDGSKSLVALQWGVAQGCALGNVKINMPSNSAGHIGINLAAGSTIAVTDVQITGGGVGIQNSNQQVNFKNIYFKYCRTAYVATGGFTALLQKVTFDTCGLGMDITGGSGTANAVLLDSESINSGTTIKFRESSTSGNRNNQIVIQNFKHDNNNPIAVNINGVTRLAATNSVDTWVWGNAIPGNFQSGTSYSTPRGSSPLIGSDGKFFTKDAPTYAGYDLDQFVNVKANANYPVKGDAATDDSASLNAILAQAAANCKIVYFPYGVYVVKSTLFIPAGSRIVGEAWATISGAGDLFKSVNSPQAIVKVGNAGDVGVAHISDMRFSVSEPLPGAKILEVNIAGGAPGDVGIWNTQVTIGGTAETTIKDVCNQQDTTNCMAAFVGVHLTASSSAYLQNIWVWTADHNLDGGSGYTIISTGRGILVESTKATWLVGTGSEHHWLYNYNFHSASNVFAGLLQTESPYMQGNGAVKLAPAPWIAKSAFGDPDFSWCNGGDGRCRTSLGENISGGSNLFLYSAANWAFFDGEWTGDYGTQCSGNCQTNMNRVTGSPSHLYWDGIGTKSADIMVLDGNANPAQSNNPGGWGGVIANYRQFN